MSMVYGQLRRIFGSKLPAATRSAAVSRPPTAKPPARQGPSVVKQLFKEPNLDKLASVLKTRSVSPSSRQKIDLYTYAIHRLARHKQFSTIEDIIEAHKSCPDIAVEGFASRLIGLYGKAGMFKHAHNLFDELPGLKCERTVVSFNSLMAAALQSEELERVLELFREYPSQLGFDPDAYSYNLVIRALAKLGSVDEAISMVDEMVEKGLKPDVITFNSLVNGIYSKKGFAEGEKAWSFMCDKIKDLVPDIKSYNSKLNALVIEDRVTEAVDLFQEMITKGLQPNSFTYHTIIKGFCEKGDVEEAKNWYRKLVQANLLPSWRTFEFLAPVLCENGDTDLAFELSKSMLGRDSMVDEGLLQRVVDKLVQDSKVESAKKLVELGQQNYYCQYNLVIPAVE